MRACEVRKGQLSCYGSRDTREREGRRGHPHYRGRPHPRVKGGGYCIQRRESGDGRLEFLGIVGW